MTAARSCVRPGIACAVLLAAGVGGASASPDVRLDFERPVPGTIAEATGEGTGFTTVLGRAPGSATVIPARLLLTNAGDDGVLAVTTTDGDAARSGAVQANALAVPIDPGVDYAVEATLLGPLRFTQNGQGAGIHIGASTSDYVKLIARRASGTGGLQLRVERDDATAAQQVRGVSTVDRAADTRLTLRLEVDVSAAQVRALFSVNGGPLLPVDPQGRVVTAPIVSAPGLTAGIISSHAAGGRAITFRYGAFTLDTPPSVEGVFPVPGTDGVPTGTNPVVSFSDAMDPATVASAVSLVRASDGAPVAATVALGADGRTATVDPVALLAPSTGYALAVAASATDASGYPLRAAARSDFATTTTPSAAVVRRMAPRLPAIGRRPAATGLVAAWNRRAGTLRLRPTGLKDRVAIRVGGRVVTPRRGVVTLPRRRAGVLLVRIAPTRAATGLLAPRVWRVALPARGAVSVRRLATR